MRWLGILLITAGLGLYSRAGVDSPKDVVSQIPQEPVSTVVKRESCLHLGRDLAVVAISTIGDVFISRAMKKVGDLGELRRIAACSRSSVAFCKPQFFAGNTDAGFGIFQLAIGLSWGDLSLVAPASASLTFVANAIAAKFFTARARGPTRWMAALLVAGGVAAVGALISWNLAEQSHKTRGRKIGHKESCAIYSCHPGYALRRQISAAYRAFHGGRPAGGSPISCKKYPWPDGFRTRTVVIHTGPG